VVIAVGVNTDGRREVLDMEIGTSEAEPIWTEFLRKLTRRGLRGVKMLSPMPIRASSRPFPRFLLPPGKIRQILNADDFISQSGRRPTGYGRGQYRIAFLGEPNVSGRWQLQFG
jgi:hypothetical protein